MRGQGFSLREALKHSDYARLRPEFDSSDLVPLLRANPDLMNDWIMYGEDKRSSCGYWVSEDTFEVGSLQAPDGTLRLKSLDEAIAEFVVRELDYWSQVGETEAKDDLERMMLARNQ